MLIILTVGILALSASVARASERPNIIIVLTDDQGYADLGSFGSPDLRTPHLDRLAEKGAKLTSFYAPASVCSPSRYGLLTGRHPSRGPFRKAVMPGDQHGLGADEICLPAVLGEVGYRSALIGKWHLGHSHEEFGPRRFGFDHFYGLMGGLVDYFSHHYGARHDWWRNEERVHEAGYATDLLTQEAVRFIDTAKDEPFFLLLAYNAPHYARDERRRPILQALPEDEALFAHIDDEDRRTYAAMIYALDRGVGEVLARLDKHDLRQRTIIVFTSDHGGENRWGADNAPLRGRKHFLWEGGIRAPALWLWPGVIAPESVIDEPLSFLDIFPTICEIVGAPLPERAQDGMDISGVLRGSEPMAERDLDWREGRWAALRRGPYKWLRHEDEEYLFHLQADAGERHNLADKHPAMVEELRAAHQMIQQQRQDTD